MNKILRTENPRLGFIGFGEVTYYMMKGLRREGAEKLCVLTRHAEPSSRKKAALLGAEITESWERLFESSDIIFSSVRGHVALETAEKAAGHIIPGQYYADLNNAVPSVKKAACALISAKGAAFVDVGLLGLPVQREHKALIYASGDAAAEFKSIMEPLGMNIRLMPGEAGQAAKIKALANIYMKSIQGVFLELAVSARRAGVSLSELESLIINPLEDLSREKDMGFWIIRGALLAERKEAEMRDATQMFLDMQVDPLMLTAAAERLKRVSGFNLGDEFDCSMPCCDYEKIVDRMFEIEKEKGCKIR